MKSGEDSNVLREWSETAAYWREHSATIRKMFAPVTQALIQAAGIVAGQLVLDVAGGAGEPSLTIAEVVGPGGSVTCTDAIAEMVATAEQDAQQHGLNNIQFRQCLADSLPFKDNSFDAVVCRLGVMFFPDVAAALREILRVTKPGGSVAFAVWGKADLNPFSHIVSDVLSQHVETPPADPDAPGAFRFAEPHKLARLLAEAGAVQVRERDLFFHIEAPISREEFWRLRSSTSGTAREKLATLPAGEARQVALEIQEAVREFFPNEQMRFPARMLVISGRKEA